MTEANELLVHQGTKERRQKHGHKGTIIAENLRKDSLTFRRGASMFQRVLYPSSGATPERSALANEKASFTIAIANV